jgi:6-phosphogluconolactonase
MKSKKNMLTRGFWLVASLQGCGVTETTVETKGNTDDPPSVTNKGGQSGAPGNPNSAGASGSAGGVAETQDDPVMKPETMSVRDGGLPSVDAAAMPADTASPVAVDPPKLFDGKTFAFVSGPTEEVHILNGNVSTGMFSTAAKQALPGGGSWGAWSPARPNLLVFSNLEGGVKSYEVNSSTGALKAAGSAATAGSRVVHVSMSPNGKWIGTADYLSDNCQVFPLSADGKLGAATATVKAGNAAHSSQFDRLGKNFFCAWHGSNKLTLYKLDDATGALTANGELEVPVRHFAFHPSGKWAYFLGQGAGVVTGFNYDEATGKFGTQIGAMRWAVGSKGGGHITITANGRFLLAAGRDDPETVAVFSIDQKTGSLTKVEGATAGLSEPRGFAVDPTGQFVIVANEGGASFNVYALDQNTGKLRMTGSMPSIGRPTFVGIFTFPK